jgi:hypothetical protein
MASSPLVHPIASSPTRSATGSALVSVTSGSFSVTPVRTSQALVGNGYQGIDSSQCGCDPPDVQVARGPTQVVEMVNLYFEVWNARGVMVAGEGLSTFYSTSNYLSDPRVIYDNLSGRFFASILSITSSVGYV